MTARTNTAEGQTSGTTLTALNSGGGSGDAFDALGGGGSCIYSNGWSAHGGQSYLVNEATLQKYAAYTGANSAAAAGREYVYLNTVPNQAQDILVLLNSGGGSVKVQFTTTGQLRVVNAAGTTVKTFTALSSLVGYRVELYAAKGASNVTGTIKCAYYLLDSTTPVETEYSSTTTDAGTTNFTGGRFMKNTASVALNAYFDEPCFSDTATTYIGPYARTGLAGVGTPTVAGVGAAGTKAATGKVGSASVAVTGSGTVGVKAGTGRAGVGTPAVTGVGTAGVKAATSAGVGTVTVTGSGSAGAKSATGSGHAQPTVTGVGTAGVKAGTGSGVGTLTVSATGSGAKACTGAPGTSTPAVSGFGGLGLKTVIGFGAGTPTVSGFGAAGAKSVVGQPGHGLLTIIGDGVSYRGVPLRDVVVAMSGPVVTRHGIVGPKTTSYGILGPVE